MKKLILNSLIGIFILFISCSKETELKKSVFIPDEDYPDLPAYTEWGYNTFGAYYDRELFIYNESEVPVKAVNTGGKTSFTFKGQKGSSDYYSYDYTDMSLIFDFIGFAPQSYSDLVVLDDISVDLTDPACKVSVLIDTSKYEADILNGTINFKRAQNLLVDKKEIEVILSGTFEFQAVIKGEPVSITLGRFDVGIGPDNFFMY
jgi:hypothetical protein